MSQTDKINIPEEVILTKIFLIMGQNVMIDRDLAELYGVETRTLNQAVKRNLKRFPEDFMFQLTVAEFENWKSQIVISNSERMSIRKVPLVFTEQGIAMLSSVLNTGISEKYRNLNKQKQISLSAQELVLRNNRSQQPILLEVAICVLQHSAPYREKLLRAGRWGYLT